jgi:hypothetical protein
MPDPRNPFVDDEDAIMDWNQNCRLIYQLQQDVIDMIPKYDSLMQDTKQLDRQQLRQYGIDARKNLTAIDLAETELRKRRRGLEFEVGKGLKFHKNLADGIGKENELEKTRAWVQDINPLLEAKINKGIIALLSVLQPQELIDRINAKPSDTLYTPTIPSQITKSLEEHFDFVEPDTEWTVDLVCHTIKEASDNISSLKRIQPLPRKGPVKGHSRSSSLDSNSFAAAFARVAARKPTFESPLARRMQQNPQPHSRLIQAPIFREPLSTPPEPSHMAEATINETALERKVEDLERDIHKLQTDIQNLSNDKDDLRDQFLAATEHRVSIEHMLLKHHIYGRPMDDTAMQKLAKEIQSHLRFPECDFTLPNLKIIDSVTLFTPAYEPTSYPLLISLNYELAKSPPFEVSLKEVLSRLASAVGRMPYNYSPKADFYLLYIWLSNLIQSGVERVEMSMLFLLMADLCQRCTDQNHLLVSSLEASIGGGKFRLPYKHWDCLERVTFAWMMSKAPYKPNINWLEPEIDWNHLETLIEGLVDKKARDIAELLCLKEVHNFVRHDKGTSFWAYTSDSTLMCLRTGHGVNSRSNEEYIWFRNEKGVQMFQQGSQFQVYLDNGTFRFLVRPKGGVDWMSIAADSVVGYLDTWYQRDMEEAVRVYRVEMGQKVKKPVMIREDEMEVFISPRKEIFREGSVEL